MAEYLKDSSELTALMVAAHKHSNKNKAEVERSEKVGCFSCLATFVGDEVSEWADQDKPNESWTALCPQCNSNAVIGDASGFVIEPDFLDEMNRFWFKGEVN